MIDFQSFNDKNFIVRGYQKVDFEFENKEDQKKQADIQLFSGSENELFDHLIVEGNYVGYRPDVKDKNVLKQKSNESKECENKRSLKEIYDEFWEFINDNNSEFKEFINKDKRRIKLKLRA